LICAAVTPHTAPVMTKMLQLFHGTTHVSAESIRKNGFQFQKIGHLSFGDGCYFFSDAINAERFACHEFGEQAAVVAVEVVVRSDRIKKLFRYELDEGAHRINCRAEHGQWHVIDATTDEGIFVVRPNAVNLIKMVHIWLPAASSFT
jgi:hypothetical protein